MCFFIVVALLMILDAGTILLGWYELSNRLFAYIRLAGVGFFVPLLLHAYLSVRLAQRHRNRKR